MRDCREEGREGRERERETVMGQKGESDLRLENDQRLWESGDVQGVLQEEDEDDAENR